MIELRLAVILLALVGGVVETPAYLADPLRLEPNDPRYGEQWALQKINAPEAWAALGVLGVEPYAGAMGLSVGGIAEWP